MPPPPLLLSKLKSAVPYSVMGARSEASGWIEGACRREKMLQLHPPDRHVRMPTPLAEMLLCSIKLANNSHENGGGKLHIRLKIYYAWKGRCRGVSRFFCPKLLPLFCLMEYGLCKGKEPRPFMYFAAVRISVMRPHLDAIESWVQTSFFFLTAGTFLFLFRFCLRNRQSTFRKVITTWYCTP